MKQIGKHLLKCISYIMSGVMLCTLFITYEAAAAKKPTLNKKKCGMTTVSYTHLDVYKRQAYNCYTVRIKI